MNITPFKFSSLNVIFIAPECHCHKNVSSQFIEEALGNSRRYSVGVQLYMTYFNDKFKISAWLMAKAEIISIVTSPVDAPVSNITVFSMFDTCS